MLMFVHHAVSSVWHITPVNTTLDIAAEVSASLMWLWIFNVELGLKRGCYFFGYIENFLPDGGYEGLHAQVKDMCIATEIIG